MGSHTGNQTKTQQGGTFLISHLTIQQSQPFVIENGYYYTEGIAYAISFLLENTYSVYTTFYIYEKEYHLETTPSDNENEVVIGRTFHLTYENLRKVEKEIYKSLQLVHSQHLIEQWINQ